MSSQPKSKLVIVTSRFPYPLEKGDKLRIYHQIRYLSQHFTIHLISLSDQKVEKSALEQLESLCESVRIYRLNLVHRVIGMCWSIVTSKPLQVGYFYHFGHARRISKYLAEIQPDFIYCQLIRTAEYVKNYHECPKTIDYMDAFSKGMERRIHLSRWYDRWFFRLESNRLREYEQRIFDYFEQHTIITEQDKTFIAHPNRSSIESIPNGIDERFFDRLQQTPSCDLVFIGNLSYVPNIEAVHYLKNEILPLVPDLTLLISGAEPSPSLKKSCSTSSQITLIGWVDDIRTSYRNGKLFIAPMMIGTGMQNKLLEAMAMGIPCITTPLANNAIGAVHGETIMVAETPEEFVSCIHQLLSDPAVYSRISEQARDFVRQRFQWETSTQKLIDIIRQ